VLTFLRVASFGAVIVAAGRPGFVVRAALFGLVCNVLFSVPLVFTVGFVGPAMGAALAFVFQVGGYCYYIARASEVPITKVFPLRTYLKIFAIAVAAGAVGWAVKFSLSGHLLLSLVAETLVVLALFAGAGTLLGVIERSDWHYLRDWLKLRAVR
jgi:peptidoglycan biosynthesis protein MviN/MurJ (putative lipid II flippase)